MKLSACTIRAMPMPVKVHPTEIPEVVVYETGFAGDNRGYFQETYSRKMLGDVGLEADFVQDNVSMSGKGTLRGLHYQIEPHSMGKFVRALRGSIFDVAVDVRRGSPTYGKWIGRTLSEQNHLAMWVPAGFAHGFQALEDDTLVLYKCTRIHTPEAERTVLFSDPAVGVAWPLETSVVHPRDAAAPPLSGAECNFVYRR
jgi:dTDP-4-dehydrorhamnose 3,5-epimerase